MKKKNKKKKQNKHDIQHGIYGHKTYVWDKGTQDSCTESGILHKKVWHFIPEFGFKVCGGLWTRAPFQYPVRRLIVRSREVSKPRDLYLKLFDRSEIWQAPRQHCCRCACQISKRCDNSNYQSHSFETSRDLMIRRLIGYWNGAKSSSWI